MANVHFLLQRLDWQTPKAVYQTLDAEFNFDFDPCPHDPKCDGLRRDWGISNYVNYVNPPYGRKIGKWCQKAYEQSRKGKVVVMLIPSRTDTRWWHDYIMRADEIRFIKGRLNFDDSGNPAPFPSAIIVFRGRKESA